MIIDPWVSVDFFGPQMTPSLSERCGPRRTFISQAMRAGHEEVFRTAGGGIFGPWARHGLCRCCTLNYKKKTSQKRTWEIWDGAGISSTSSRNRPTHLCFSSRSCWIAIWSMSWCEARTLQKEAETDSASEISSIWYSLYSHVMPFLYTSPMNIP